MDIYIPEPVCAKSRNKFKLDKITHKRTPGAANVRITKDDAGVEVDQTLYRSMIGSLLYLTACTGYMLRGWRMCPVSSKS